jgi:hypothetical protein
MKRLFWLAMGVTIGALVTRRLTKLAERLTPKGMAGTIGSSLADLATEVRHFAGDVRESMGQRERELRTGTGFPSAPNGRTDGQGTR